MKEYHYADGVSHVTFSGGMVRLNLFCYGARPAAGGELPHEPAGQLVLTPAAFLSSFATMQRFVRELEQQGLIALPAAHTQAQPASAKVPHSPNFE